MTFQLLLHLLPVLREVSGSKSQGLNLLAARQLTNRSNTTRRTSTLSCTLGPGDNCTCGFWNQCWIAMEVGEWMADPLGPACPEGTHSLPGGCFYCGCDHQYHSAGECQAAGDSWCGLTTTPTTTTTTTTTMSPLRGDGRIFDRLGDDTACRGTTPQDNNPNYFEVVEGIRSAEACRELCLQKLPRCKGIEFSPGRCELWTRKGGIFNTAPLAGSVCERFGWPVARFQDMGDNSECHGDYFGDREAEYYERYDDHTAEYEPPRSLEDCKARCAASPVCFGIQYDYESGRNICMVWKRPITQKSC